MQKVGTVTKFTLNDIEYDSEGELLEDAIQQVVDDNTSSDKYATMQELDKIIEKLENLRTECKKLNFK